MSDAMRRSEKMERGFYLININELGIHQKRGACWVPALQETGLTGPLFIYKVVPKVPVDPHLTISQT